MDFENDVFSRVKGKKLIIYISNNHYEFMETIPKVGILVGIVAVSIFLPFWMIVTIAENEALFVEFFFNEDLVERKMKETKTYKAMLERYPDSIVSLRNHGPFNSDMEIIAYSNSSESHLNANIGFDHQNDFTWEHVRCRVGDGDNHKKLGTTPPELIENNPPIPRYMFKEGNADNTFTSDFIKFTNCLDMNNQQIKLQELDADYHIAIPENTGVPGCQEDLSCFEPYSLKIKVGDVVSFRNFDSDYHTVTSGSPEFGPGGEFDSGLMESGDKFFHNFTKADEYEYFCMVHPWQTGKIIVHEK